MSSSDSADNTTKSHRKQKGRFSSLISVSHGLDYLQKKGLGLQTLLFDSSKKEDKGTGIAKIINKQDVFVVAETIQGVFAGYAPLSNTDITTLNNWFSCQQAFLAFSTTKKVYSPVPNGAYDMYYTSGYCCVAWGGGHVLHLGTGETFSGAYINPHATWNTSIDFIRTNLDVQRVYVFKVGGGKHGKVDVGLCMHPAVNDDEYEQLCIMSEQVLLRETQAVFDLQESDGGVSTLSHSEAAQRKQWVALCSILQSGTRIITVRSPEALNALATGLCAEETAGARSDSSITQLSIEFSGAADAKDVSTVMQNLGPFAHIVTAPCTSQSHAKALVQAVSTSATKIKCLELRDCENIEGAGLEELEALSKEKHLKRLVFLTTPKEGKAYTRLIMELARKHPTLEVETECSVDDLPILTKEIAIPVGLEPIDRFHVKMLPFTTTALPGKIVGFHCWTPHSSTPSTAMIMCCPEEAAIACSNFLRRCSEDGAIPPMSPHPQHPPPEALVKLLIRYMIYAKQHVSDALNEEGEAKFRITVRDEKFLQLMVEEANSSSRRAKLMVALELLHMASYLQMPSLKRLLRSFIIDDDPFST